MFFNDGNQYGQSQYGQGQYIFPFMFMPDLDNDIKVSHDEYKVYVNDNYVGKKVLLAENEKPEDLDKYLFSQGFDEFSTELTGGNLIIHCDDKINSESISNLLEGYLQNR